MYQNLPMKLEYICFLFGKGKYGLEMVSEAVLDNLASSIQSLLNLSGLWSVEVEKEP